MTLIVNLYGGPGAGKSTTASKIFSILKDRNINCELVTEFAKDLVWSDNYKDLKDSLYVLANQNRRIKRLVGKVDVVVTDSPLLLSTIYGDLANDVDFTYYVYRTYHNYRNLDVLLERKKDYNPVGRLQTEEEAKSKDKVIEGLLDPRYTTVMKYPTTEEIIEKVVDLIKDKD